MVFNEKYGVYVTKAGLVFKVANYGSHGHVRGALYLMTPALDKTMWAREHYQSACR